MNSNELIELVIQTNINKPVRVLHCSQIWQQPVGAANIHSNGLFFWRGEFFWVHNKKSVHLPWSKDSNLRTLCVEHTITGQVPTNPSLLQLSNNTKGFFHLLREHHQTRIQNTDLQKHQSCDQLKWTISNLNKA